MFRSSNGPFHCALLIAASYTWAAAAQDARIEFFEKKVRPVLVEHCFQCHSDQIREPKSDLRLDSRAALLAGGARGPALVPGEPEKSRLIEAIRYKNVQLHMPPKGKLPDALIADLEKWIADGAAWPGNDAAVIARKRDFDVMERKRTHWAWQPVQPPPAPKVQHANGPVHPVDAFVLRKLEEKKLLPAGRAEPHVVLRRLYFDLVGLPPTPEALEEFEKQSAIDSMVDRLLESPQFGERWARHWLDLVRYAESRGHEFDHTLPNAWQYRDYVIRAINADVPYSQFVLEHIAGDLLPKPRMHADGFNESILGTGFWFLGEEVHSPVDIRLDQADRFDNRIDVFSKTFLGMTVACARCHDHKFDAISTKDYYALFGYLESSNYRSVRFDHWDHNRRIAGDLWRLRDQRQKSVAADWSASVRAGVLQTSDYLRAAYRVLQSKEPRNTSIADTAKKHNLDGRRLGAWVIAIEKAAANSADPLHLFSRLAADTKDLDSRRIQELLRPVSDRATPKEATRSIIDFSSSNVSWLPDDVGFGPGPARVGLPITRKSEGGVSIRFRTVAAAEKDPAFDSLKVAPGTESDAGALASPNRAGRTIRTPTFRIGDGRLFVRMRGSAQVYAAVAQHVMIAGPLHGKLVQHLKAGKDFEWRTLDMQAYKGLPVHLEFTAEDGTEFAVAGVWEGAKPNDVPHFEELRGSLNEAKSLSDAAIGYQQTFAAAIAKPGHTPEHARLADWIASHPELIADDDAWRKSAEQFLQAEGALIAQIRKESRLALAIQDGPGFDEHVFVRGLPTLPGEVVPRRFLEALDGGPAERSTSGRLSLAQKVIDPRRNPFIARVLVNRVWHHLFGRGLVASVDNFGVLGETPTHPELLDYLADWFVQNGWSLKKLIKFLVTTQAYQRSSRGDEQAIAADPQNLYLQRARVRRLEGEAIRDALLRISGRLDAKMFGAPVPVHLSPFQDGRGRPASGPVDGAGRRSIYLSVRRNFLSSFLLAFDTPTPFSTMGRRTTSNVPAQALILLNDPFVQEQAVLWAKRVLQGDKTTEERISLMYRQAFGRSPTKQELSDCKSFLAEQAHAKNMSANDPSIWADLAHVLVNAKEFIYPN